LQKPATGALAGIKQASRTKFGRQGKSGPRQPKKIPNGSPVRLSAVGTLPTLISVPEHKKDPGIPNNFPYKDQILAEVAEQRRLVSLLFVTTFPDFTLSTQAAEEKEKKKADKKGKKKVASGEDGGDEEEGKADTGQNSDDEMGVASLHAKRLIRAKATSKPVEVAPEPEEEEEEAPALVNRDLPTLSAVLDHADVVIEVLDARDPLSFRSSHLEELASAKEGRETLFLLNKIGAILVLQFLLSSGSHSFSQTQPPARQLLLGCLF
jgi:nuclear GTP-binding protein